MGTEELREITDEDIKETTKLVAALSEEKRTELLAKILLYNERTVSILKYLIIDKGVFDNALDQLSREERREIEQSLSFGPSWLNYTRKTRDKQ